ncbi:transporter substrate-binding domain-containing protein [Chitinibacter sp. SCUT-21]|uniref:hypothetical protein n=1 Tax=Chitinibacter sp. SCUT-21 TaxID=2970891 RepID=UPI0035A5A0A5
MLSKILLAFFLLHSTWLYAESKIITLTRFGEQGTLEKSAEAKLTQAYAQLGYQLRFSNLPGKRALIESNEGIYDGELIRKPGLSTEYPNLIQVNVPIASISIVAYARDPSIQLEQGWTSLRAHSFAYERGTQLIENNIKGFARSLATSDNQIAFQNLLLHRVDLVISHQAGALEILQKLPNSPKLYQLSPPLVVSPLYHYVHKKHADLVAPLEAKLRQLEGQIPQ